MAAQVLSAPCPCLPPQDPSAMATSRPWWRGFWARSRVALSVKEAGVNRLLLPAAPGIAAAYCYNLRQIFTHPLMNILYEEDGSFKVGSIMADNTTSLQVENVSGKRSKVKAANVMLRFTQPALADFLAQAEALAETIEVDFLWECCP